MKLQARATSPYLRAEQELRDGPEEGQRRARLVSRREGRKSGQRSAKDRDVDRMVGKREVRWRTLSGLANHFSLGIGALLPIWLRSTSWSVVQLRARENHAHQGRGRLPFPDGKCMHCAVTSSLGTTAKATARLDFQDRIAGCWDSLRNVLPFCKLSLREVLCYVDHFQFEAMTFFEWWMFRWYKKDLSSEILEAEQLNEVPIVVLFDITDWQHTYDKRSLFF